MADRRFKVADSTAAIWTGAGDTLPFTDPLGHADRVLFTTKFNYTRIIDKRTVNCTFPKANNGAELVGTINLFAHGISGIPRVRGNVTIDGHNLSMGCHIPIQTQFGTYQSISSFRIAVLGANNTYVVVSWYANMLGFGDAAGTILPSFTIPITVEVTNELN